MKWYYSDAGQQIGPIDDAAFQELVRRGVIRDDTQVWREGMAGWAPYSTVKPAAPAAPVYTPPPPAAPIPPAAYPAQFMPPAAAAAVAKAESSGMFFFYPVLKALNDGRIIRRGVIIFLQILAVLSVLGGLLGAVTSLSAGANLGTILGAVVMLAATLCIAQIFWYRASSINELAHATADAYASKFTVIPIASLLCRMIGEVAATFMVAVGFSMFLVLLLSSSSGGMGGLPMGGIPGMPFPMPGGIAGAFISLIVFSAAGFLELVIFYAAAEWIVVLVDIAQNTHMMVKQGEARK